MRFLFAIEPIHLILDILHVLEHISRIISRCVINNPHCLDHLIVSNTLSCVIAKTKVLIQLCLLPPHRFLDLDDVPGKTGHDKDNC
jgi:hypothetical protein